MKPSKQARVAVSNLDGVFADELGQRWSPAVVRVEWPEFQGLPKTSVSINVVSAVRPDMNARQLRRAQIIAAIDALGSACRELLAFGEPDVAPSEQPARPH